MRKILAFSFILLFGTTIMAQVNPSWRIFVWVSVLG